MDAAELIKRVRAIEIKSRGISNNLFTGQYHSAFKGRGMSFSEVRSYQYGDDVRNIEWNVTARTGSPFVKVFEEERELTTMLMVDVSASNYFGSSRQFKSDLITEIAAVMAFSALRNNDKVGLALFSDHIELFIPPKKGRSHILRLIREMVNFEPKGNPTDIGAALQAINQIIRKRSICFLLSDFQTLDYDRALAITSPRHDLVGIKVFDASDKVLPRLGIVRVEDPETGKALWIDTLDPAAQRSYQQRYLACETYAQTAFARANADFVQVQTGQPYIQTLLQLFKSRAR
jgi:uncharacterized protein (DUF58 family)